MLSCPRPSIAFTFHPSHCLPSAAATRHLFSCSQASHTDLPTSCSFSSWNALSSAFLSKGLVSLSGKVPAPHVLTWLRTLLWCVSGVTVFLWVYIPVDCEVFHKRTIFACALAVCGNSWAPSTCLVRGGLRRKPTWPAWWLAPWTQGDEPPLLPISLLCTAAESPLPLKSHVMSSGIGMEKRLCPI